MTTTAVPSVAALPAQKFVFSFGASKGRGEDAPLVSYAANRMDVRRLSPNDQLHSLLLHMETNLEEKKDKRGRQHTFDTEAARRAMVAGADPCELVRAERAAGKERLLHMAAVQGSVPACRLLLEAGAEPDQPGASRLVSEFRHQHGVLPLFLAAAGGHAQVVRVLMSHGADFAPALYDSGAHYGTDAANATRDERLKHARQRLLLAATCAQRGVPTELEHTVRRMLLACQLLRHNHQLFSFRRGFAAPPCDRAPVRWSPPTSFVFAPWNAEMKRGLHTAQE